MDFSKSIDFDGFSVNTVSRSAGGRPMSGYQVTQFDPSDLEVAGYYEKRALNDGADASDVYLGRRRPAMIVTTFGSTAGDFWDKHQDLLAAFMPTISYNADTANLGFRPLNFYQPTADIVSWPTSAYPNGIPLRYYVRPDTVGFSLRRDELGGDAAKGLSLPVRLVLTARDPRKYLQTETTVSIASGTTSASNANTPYEGDYPTGKAVLTIISAAATGSAVVRVEAATMNITIDAASTTYTLDLGERTYSKNGVKAMNLLDEEFWPQIGTDDHVNIVRQSATCAISLSITYRPAFA